MPIFSSFTRLERRKSLIERHRLVSCRAAQVKLLSTHFFDYVEIDRAAAGNLETINCRPAQGIAHFCSVGTTQMSPAARAQSSSPPRSTARSVCLADVGR